MKRSALGVMVAWLVLSPLNAAYAACDPAAANNVTATCTGVTVNQNGLNGYGTGGETNLNVTVVSGASVTGTLGGIAISSGTIINFGTVGTIGGAGNFGVLINSSGNVINFGTITGGAQGVTGGTFNVSNSGTITGFAQGIFALGTLNVSNSGTITGFGSGISTATTASVTNSGTISGFLAIEFVGGADTLTLLPGSKIIGAINLGGGGDTVNFRGGNHNLTFDTLAGATVTGTTPFVVSGNQAVAIDPTPFAVNGRLVGDFSRSVSQVVPNFGNQPATTAGAPTAFAAEPSTPSSVVSSAFDGIPGMQAYAADQAVFKAPTVVHTDGTAIWARGFGGYRVQQADGELLRTASIFYGGAIGIEKQVRPDLRVGVFAGGGTTRSTIELNSGDTDSSLGFGGLYARYFRGASFLYAAVQGGGSRNDTTRNINNNLAPGGLETAKGSYSGWYVSPELKLGHNVVLGNAFGAQYTLTPSIQVRYLYGSFGSYTETGSTANLTVNSQTVQTLEERAELKLTRATAFNATTALLIDLFGGALGVQRVGSNTVNAALLGQAIPFATPGKDDVWGGFGGLGIEFRHANVAVFGSAEYLALSDNSSVVSGKGGVRVAF